MAVALVLGTWPPSAATDGDGAGVDPFVVVTPDPVDLADGDPLLIVGHGPAGDASAALHCAATVAVDLADCEIGTIGIYNEPTFTEPAKRWITTANHGLVDCAVVECAVGVDVVELAFSPPFGSPSATPLWRAVVPATFAHVRGIHVSPFGPSRHVGASRLAAPEGAAAFAMRCAGVGGQLVCGDVGSVVTDFDGEFLGEVSGATIWSSDGVDVDCRVHACHVAVVVLAPGPSGPVVADLIGTPMP